MQFHPVVLSRYAIRHSGDFLRPREARISSPYSSISHLHPKRMRLVGILELCHAAVRSLALREWFEGAVNAECRIRNDSV